MNNLMNLVLLKPVSSNSLSEFIEFWSKQYYYPKNEHFYDQNIRKESFTEQDIIELYQWKNGMKLSEKKQKSLESKILFKLEIINDLKHQELPILDFFLKEFKKVSFVWKVFLLHIIKPNTYPIYDQHIHRAYKYLKVQDSYIQEAGQHEFYFNYYLPFIQAEQIKDIKKLDEAFFAFGQFLNIKNYKKLL